MKCRDLMNPEVLWIPGTASVRQAASLMRDHSVGLLLVSGDTPEQFEGIVTDRDLAVRVCAEGLSLDDTPVSAVTTRDAVACSETEELGAAEKRMRNSQKSRLIVLDRHGHPSGMLTLTDVLHGDRALRALKTARGVLRHEAEVPHPPVENIKLTPSTPEDEEVAMRPRRIRTGSWRISTKEFPD